jgi:hypothetical protein
LSPRTAPQPASTATAKASMRLGRRKSENLYLASKEFATSPLLRDTSFE